MPSTCYQLDAHQASLKNTHRLSNFEQKARYFSPGNQFYGQRSMWPVLARAMEKMAQFIRNRSHGTNPGNEGKPCQSIVISLKDYFFDKADSLVGVCRDIDQACSRVLTFDLEKYPEGIEE